MNQKIIIIIICWEIYFRGNLQIGENSN